MECLTSFDKYRYKKPSQVIAQCTEAIDQGLNPAEEAIIHGLLMSCYARQRQLEMGQRELLCAREAVGKLIGLAGKELSDWVVMDFKKQRSMDWQDIIHNKVDVKEHPLLSRILSDIVVMPRYPQDFREDLSEIEKEEGALEFWSNFPESSTEIYELLGDGWAAQGRPDLAIKWLKRLVTWMVDVVDYQGPRWELISRTKLAKQYQQKGKKGSAAKEYKKALEAPSHAKSVINEILSKSALVEVYERRYKGADWQSFLLRGMEDEYAHYWIAKAKRGLAETE